MHMKSKLSTNDCGGKYIYFSSRSDFVLDNKSYNLFRMRVNFLDHNHHYCALSTTRTWNFH